MSGSLPSTRDSVVRPSVSDNRISLGGRGDDVGGWSGQAPVEGEMTTPEADAATAEVAGGYHAYRRAHHGRARRSRRPWTRLRIGVEQGAVAAVLRRRGRGLDRIEIEQIGDGCTPSSMEIDRLGLLSYVECLEPGL